MKKLRRRIAIVSVLALAVILLPFVWSRVFSQSNRLKIHSGESSASDSTDGLIDGLNDDSFSLGCYNIAHGRGLAESNWSGGAAESRIERLDEIAALLKTLDADVVVLNEVDFDASWSNRQNQAQYLAEKAGYAFRAEQRNLDFQLLNYSWRFGNAILSRYPIVAAKVVDLPSYSNLETAVAGKKRGLYCDVEFGDRTVRVMGGHLSHRSEDLRERSARAILKQVELSPFPLVLAGDMNSTPDGFPKVNLTIDHRNALETLDAAGLLDRVKPSLPLTDADFTFPSDAPQQIIDWIFVSKPLRIESHRVIDSTLSDHRPVSARLRWNQ